MMDYIITAALVITLTPLFAYAVTFVILLVLTLTGKKQ